MWGYVSAGAGTQRGQKRALDSLEPELWVIVSYRTPALGTQLRFSAGGACTPNH